MQREPAALPAGTVADLLLPENIEDLKALLPAHVVPALVDVSSGALGKEVGAPTGYETGTVLVDDG